MEATAITSTDRASGGGRSMSWLIKDRVCARGGEGDQQTRPPGVSVYICIRKTQSPKYIKTMTLSIVSSSPLSFLL